MSERVSILVSLDGSDEGLKGAITSAEQSLNGMGAAGKAAGSQAADGLGKIAPAAKDAGKAFDDLGKTAFAFNNIKTAVEDLVHALGGTPLEVLKTADAYNSLAARIKLVTGEGAAFQTAFEGVQKVAIATRSDLEATGTLFARIAQAGKDMGLSQQQALSLTQSINQAIQVSGASAASSDAAITQLIQGLQSGVLRGEEFNSVMEQAPRLAQALAAGLGVGTGELRKMAEQGQLTSTTVIKALQSQSDTIADEFAKLPPSVGGALKNLGTAWQVYVGEVDKSTGATVTAANAINTLADNIRPVAGFLVDAGKAFAAVVALKMAEYLYTVGQAAQQTATAIAAKTAATTAATVSTVAATVATAKDAQATAELTAVIDLNKAATDAVVRTQAVRTANLLQNSAALSANTAAQLENAAAAKAAALGYTSLNGAMVTYMPAMREAPKAIGDTSRAVETLRLGMSGSAEAITDVTAKIKPASAGMDALGKAADGTKKSMFEGASVASLLGQGFIAAGTAASGAFTLASGVAKSFMALIGGIPGLALMILANAKDIGTWLGEFVAQHTSAGRQLAENEQKLAAINADAKKRAEERAAIEAKLSAESDKAIAALVKGREEAEKRIPVIEKEVKATEQHAKVMEAMVKLSGDEGQALRVGAEQAEKVAMAKQKAADAETAVVASIRAQIDALQQQIAIQNGPQTKAQTDELKRLGELLSAKTAEAEVAATAAEGARIEAAARTLASESYKDNAKNVAAFTQKVEDASAKLDILKTSGVASESAINAATLELNKALGLQKDAVADLVKSIDAKMRSETAAIQVQQAQTEASIKHYELLAKEAAASGDLVRAQEFETSARKESIKVLQLQYDGTNKEIQAALESLKVRREHVSGSEEERQKQLEVIAVEEKLLLARKAGNEGIKDRIQGIKDEIKEMNSLEGAFKTLGVTSDKELQAAADKSFDAFQKIASSGQASAREVRDAFKKFAEDAIKANDGVADEFIKSQASAHGLAIEVDATGKSIVKAMDSGSQSIKGATGYMDAFKQSALAATAALEAQNAELEREISAQEKANELKERALELERKRKNVDKDGFVLDNNGNRLQISVPTRAGVFEQAKSRGLSEAQALQIADRFIGEDGKQTGWQQTGKTWSVALNEAIEKLILDNARNTASGNGNGSGLGSANNTKNGTPDRNSTSHTVTVNMGGNKKVIETKTVNDASTLTGILQQLGNDSRRAA